MYYYRGNITRIRRRRVHKVIGYNYTQFHTFSATEKPQSASSLKSREPRAIRSGDRAVRLPVETKRRVATVDQHDTLGLWG